jgi:hypothetical protein
MMCLFLCNCAPAIVSIRPVTLQDFIEALKTIKPNAELTKREKGPPNGRKRSKIHSPRGSECCSPVTPSKEELTRAAVHVEVKQE